jgi:uncharacterized protein YdeI (YjbR/CyaY-like superfamily)
MNIIYFKAATEFREWLAENHAKEKEVYLGFYKKEAKEKGITYPEAVEQALCFGWIDGIRKGVDAASYTNRFTPRKAKSIWSQVNLKKIAELIEAGLMHPAGLKVYNERDQTKTNLYSFEAESRQLSDDFIVKFKTNQKAWQYFQSQSASYQKTASWWVMSAKREETRLKRLDILIANSEEGMKIPELRR